tara:strand:- start:393 stop:1496 length:1104 start_codon:yes stop_codon:yes gene_type:complete
MKYYLNLFSPSTWDHSRKKGSKITGFSIAQKTQAKNISVDSIFLCYLVRVSRWVGILKTTSESFQDNDPIFMEENDKYVIRFNVDPMVILDPDKGLPIKEEFIWNQLEWTKDKPIASPSWASHFQRSLREMPEKDGEFLYNLLLEQNTNQKEYPLTKRENRIISRKTTIITPSGEHEVDIPDDDEINTIEEETIDIRDSLKIQIAIANIGAQMGYDIWLPRSDRTSLGDQIPDKVKNSLVEELPFAFDETSLRTIENIDVLWIEERSIVRAFEVEHTTAIYSGLLRMSDLLSLLPNFNINLHIVAPEEKRDRVLREINRPTFFILQSKSKMKCTYISYDSINKLKDTPNLQHTNHTILEEFEEEKDF